MWQAVKMTMKVAWTMLAAQFQISQTEPKHAWQFVTLETFVGVANQTVIPPEYILLHGKPALLIGLITVKLTIHRHSYLLNIKTPKLPFQNFNCSNTKTGHVLSTDQFLYQQLDTKQCPRNPLSAKFSHRFFAILRCLYTIIESISVNFCTTP